MYLVHSALTTTAKTQTNAAQQHQTDHELTIRYQAYQTTCDKFSREIAAIQKYIPGWIPKFSY